MESRINYIVLFIVITIGVTTGTLISNLITTNLLEAELDSEKKTEGFSKTEPVAPSNTAEDVKPVTTQETVKLSPEKKIEPEIVEKSINQDQLIEQRKLDENGIRLAKTCNEWTIVHKDMQTQTSERGMNKHCAEYYDYLSFGNSPDSY